MSDRAELARWRRVLLYYGAHVGVAIIVLAVMQHLRHAPLRVPWAGSYSGDGLFFTALSKAVHEDGIWHASHIGAPFGADIVDWPLGLWLSLATIHLLYLVFGEPGTAMNLFWMSTIVVAGLGATYAFRRLRVGPGLSFVCGMLYAFLPYASYRNIWHFNLVYPIVPLLCLLCLRVAGTRPEDQSRSERVILWTACILQGFSYVYYSFFACMLLVAAIPLGVARRRSLAALRTGALGLLLVVAPTALTLAPSLIYTHMHGPNAVMAYKRPMEADVYGLKLRHLLTPISEHPLPPFAAVAAAVERARFRGENENATARLGTLGSLGLIALLVFVLARAAGVPTGFEEDLGPAGALTLVALLVAQVGGLGSIFNLFVAPEIRAYNRIVVYIAFFALLSAAVIGDRLFTRLRPPGRFPLVPRGVALPVLLVAGLFDQTPYTQQATPAYMVADFDNDRAFVRTIEGQLPAEAMIFQLPDGGIPFGPYEYARPYLHSHKIRWSWGSITGRRNWQEMVYRLSPEETVRWATVAGFAGLWIDRAAYTGRDGWFPYEGLEQSIAKLPVGAARVSANGRYSFFPLEPYARRLEATVGSAAFGRLRDEALRTLPAYRWLNGCSSEWPEADGWWRSCGSVSHLFVLGSHNSAVHLRLAGWFRAHDGIARRLVVSVGETQALLEIGAEPVTWSFDLELPEDSRSRLNLVVESGPPCGGTTCLDARLIATALSEGAAPPAPAAPPDDSSPTGSPL